MKILLALLAGAVNAAAFAPLGWWPLGLLSMGVLFGLWSASGRAAAAWQGFAFGVGMFGAGISWIYVSLHVFGGMSPPLAGLCVALLALAIALYPAAAGWAQGGFLKRSTALRCAVVMPCVWLLFEWLRGWLLTGFPWLTTGYAMLDTPLAGWAPLGGVYLLSLLALMSAGAVLALLLKASKWSALSALLLALGWLGGWQLHGMPWTQAVEGKEISVAIIQNNVPLMLKWNRAGFDRIIKDYLAQSARHRDVDLVVWPEAAAPDYLDNLPADFRRRLQAHPADFIFGALTRQASGGQWRNFNSIAAFGQATGEAAGQADSIHLYHKQRLVPFGEFLPMKWLFQPLLKTLDIPMSDFSGWRQPQNPLPAAGIAWAASICYEDAFPQVWRSQIPASGALINLSEDAWFGDSLAPHQRLQMARFRSLESARPMIRSANNGLSAVINWRGGIDAIAPQFVKTVLVAQVRPRTGVTPYTEYGNAPALALALALLALGLLFSRRKLR